MGQFSPWARERAGGLEVCRAIGDVDRKDTRAEGNLFGVNILKQKIQRTPPSPLPLPAVSQPWSPSLHFSNGAALYCTTQGSDPQCTLVSSELDLVGAFGEAVPL